MTGVKETMTVILGGFQEFQNSLKRKDKKLHWSAHILFGFQRKEGDTDMMGTKQDLGK